MSDLPVGYLVDFGGGVPENPVVFDVLQKQQCMKRRSRRGNAVLFQKLLFYVIRYIVVRMSKAVVLKQYLVPCVRGAEVLQRQSIASTEKIGIE